ncbi:hypothetical protein J5F27_02795 [Schleiferilactobacillus harbinensis]|uniref:hypothetical protein n=1 Tax=Schleiferilactobacillus harbinensis TaxID=304207 RepID=UPI001AAEC457|nr:hypothetical protein [Schleiferilactobacillus harbinensis]MBO3090846.1 hypothetical protein [Schleiferilactobacillus harbinensis]
MKKIEPTALEDYQLQQQVSHYIKMTPVMGKMRQFVERWKDGETYGHDQATSRPIRH